MVLPLAFLGAYLVFCILVGLSFPKIISGRICDAVRLGLGLL
jgi:hypothetical protein